MVKDCLPFPLPRACPAPIIFPPGSFPFTACPPTLLAPPRPHCYLFAIPRCLHSPVLPSPCFCHGRCPCFPSSFTCPLLGLYPLSPTRNKSPLPHMYRPSSDVLTWNIREQAPPPRLPPPGLPHDTVSESGFRLDFLGAEIHSA